MNENENMDQKELNNENNENKENNKEINENKEVAKENRVENIEKKETISDSKEKQKKPKRKKVRGFAGVIWNQLKPLNDSDYFKEHHGQDKFNIFLIATDDRHAALVKVANGQVDVEDIKKEKDKPLDLKAYKWDGLLKCTTEEFFAIAMGKMSNWKYIKMILKRQIRGVSAMLKFSSYFKILSHLMKEKIKNSAESKQE